MDDEEGGFLAAEHLIKLGHRRIAGFFKTDDLQGANRMKGFIRAHRHYEVPMIPDAVAYYSSEEKQTKPHAAALALLKAEQEERPTAFVCYNDELALALMGTAKAGGIRVPDDLSIVGFDDSTLALAADTKLTTLTHPKTAMGAQAAELLLDLIAGKAGGTAADIVYKPELVARESTRAVNV